MYTQNIHFLKKETIGSSKLLKFLNEFYPTRMAKIEIPTIGEDVEQQKLSGTAGNT